MTTYESTLRVRLVEEYIAEIEGLDTYSLMIDSRGRTAVFEHVTTVDLLVLIAHIKAALR